MNHSPALERQRNKATVETEKFCAHAASRECHICGWYLRLKSSTALIPMKPQPSQRRPRRHVDTLVCTRVYVSVSEKAWIKVSNQSPVQRSRRREVFVLPNQPPAQKATGFVSCPLCFWR